MERQGIWIGGTERRGRGEPMPVVNPYTQDVFAEVDTASDEDVADAVELAHASFRDVMRTMPAHRRAAILRKAAELMPAWADDLAASLVREAGKPIALCRVEARRAAEIFSLAADAAKHVTGEVLPLDVLPGGEGRMGMVLRVPLGVVAAITPFNAPINLSLQKVAPALAAGCTVVLKPADQTPITVLKLGRLLREAGVPDGAVSILPGRAATGRALVGHPKVAVVSFTGSAAVGERIQQAAGIKKVILELGSNAPNIVCADADLDQAAAAIVQAGFNSSGQICVSAQRVYVHTAVVRPFLDRFLPLVADLKIGDPLDESVTLGALINPAALERIETWVREAVAEGATVLAGGRRHDGGRNFLPTVLTNVKPTMKVQCEEVFGPVLTITPFDTVDQAIDMANDSVYGLQAGVFTHDVATAFRVARDLEVGSVWINDASRTRLDNTPGGGVKRSGVGREGGRYSLEEFTTLKFVGLKLA
jgi:acyl-CoA reductase-like NAD-dependent aldehyde dehydrogenase